MGVNAGASRNARVMYGRDPTGHSGAVTIGHGVGVVVYTVRGATILL